MLAKKRFGSKLKLKVQNLLIFNNSANHLAYGTIEAFDFTINFLLHVRAHTKLNLISCSLPILLINFKPFHHKTHLFLKSLFSIQVQTCCCCTRQQTRRSKPICVNSFGKNILLSCPSVGIKIKYSQHALCLRLSKY